MAITNTLLLTTAAPISESVSTDSAITVILFCNNNTPDPFDPTAGVQYVNVHVVKNGDIPSITNKIVSQIPIDAGDTFTFSSERIVLSSGDQIYASSTDDNIVSATISYVVI
jgi:hypothetical protein